MPLAWPQFSTRNVPCYVRIAYYNITISKYIQIIPNIYIYILVPSKSVSLFQHVSTPAKPAQSIVSSDHPQKFSHSNQGNFLHVLPSLLPIHLGSVPSAPTTPASAPTVPSPPRSHPEKALRSRPRHRPRPPQGSAGFGPCL